MPITMIDLREDEITAEKKQTIAEAVRDMVTSATQGNAASIHQLLFDVKYRGAISAAAPQLDSDDTFAAAWYQQHKEEINVIIARECEAWGTDVMTLWGSFDRSDPLMLHTNNQAILARIAFKEVCSYSLRSGTWAFWA